MESDLFLALSSGAVKPTPSSLSPNASSSNVGEVFNIHPAGPRADIYPVCKLGECKRGSYEPFERDDQSKFMSDGRNSTEMNRFADGQTPRASLIAGTDKGSSFLTQISSSPPSDPDPPRGTQTDNERLQHLLAQQALIQAQITALLPSKSYQHSRAQKQDSKQTLIQARPTILEAGGNPLVSRKDSSGLLLPSTTGIFQEPHSRHSSGDEQAEILTGIGASHEPQRPDSVSFPYAGFSGEKTEKSPSKEYTCTVSSQSSQMAQRLKQRIALARLMMPKDDADTFVSRESSSQVVARPKSLNEVAISSTMTYRRPKHDWVYCKQCANHSERFRGEHELRRHQAREHNSLVRKWICVEPDDGLTHPKPITPFSKCKACHQQK